MTDQSALSELYYLTSIAGPERRKWFCEILVENKIYFRNRDELNDPAELRPASELKGNDDEMRAYVRGLVGRFRPHLPPAARVLETERLLRNFRRNGFDPSIFDAELGRWGIVSLTESPAEPLMWSHYANGHRGIALVFDANSGLFATAQRVQYQEAPPIINRLHDDGDTLLTKAVLTKSSEWRYEHEWRVLARSTGDDLSPEIDQLPNDVRAFLEGQHGSGHYQIPATAVKAVILGAKCSADDEAWIRATTALTGTAISIRRASFSFGSITIAEEPGP